MKTYLLFLLFFCNICKGQDILKISSCGDSLKLFYLAQDVPHKWLAGYHINWETGESDMPEAETEIKTHCSAFVAAVCKKQNIYILRPPDHKQNLLANAQYDWLNSVEGADAGWHKITGDVFYQAQKLANEGYIVVASTQNPDMHKPGHIAFVMPAVRSTNKLKEQGPILIQAGKKNFNKITLINGFKSHILDWNLVSNNILFYYNDKKYDCH